MHAENVLERHGEVCFARREKRIQRRGRTTNWNRSFGGFGTRGSVRERQERKDGGMEKGGRERDRGESRSAPVVPERGPGVKRVPLTS